MGPKFLYVFDWYDPATEGIVVHALKRVTAQLYIAGGHHYRKDDPNYRYFEDRDAAVEAYRSSLTVYIKLGVVSSMAASVYAFSSSRSGRLVYAG
jgi:hypothetical protein